MSRASAPWPQAHPSGIGWQFHNDDREPCKRFNVGGVRVDQSTRPSPRARTHRTPLFRRKLCASLGARPLGTVTITRLAFFPTTPPHHALSRRCPLRTRSRTLNHLILTTPTPADPTSTPVPAYRRLTAIFSEIEAFPGRSDLNDEARKEHDQYRSNAKNAASKGKGGELVARSHSSNRQNAEVRPQQLTWLRRNLRAKPKKRRTL